MYLLHWPDATGVPLADTWRAMAALVDAGHVRSIGLSNSEREDIARCHGERHVDVIQTGRAPGLTTHGARDIDRLVRARGHGAVTIYEPVASGLLTDVPFEQVRERGSARTGRHTISRTVDVRGERRAGRQIVDGLAGASASRSAHVPCRRSPSRGWLRQPGVAAVIAGSGKPERFRSSAAAGDLRLPDDALKTIDDELLPLVSPFARASLREPAE